jgi:hypothetical protein
VTQIRFLIPCDCFHSCACLTPPMVAFWRHVWCAQACQAWMTWTSLLCTNIPFHDWIFWNDARLPSVEFRASSCPQKFSCHSPGRNAPLLRLWTTASLTLAPPNRVSKRLLVTPLC